MRIDKCVAHPRPQLFSAAQFGGPDLEKLERVLGIGAQTKICRGLRVEFLVKLAVLLVELGVVFEKNGHVAHISTGVRE
jgi:hypothetical protein